MHSANWMGRLACRLVAALAFLVGIASASPAFETAARTAILIDYATGEVLFEKDADQSVPPASLSKLMTVAVIFNELKAGRLKLDDRFTVSENAWRTGGAASGGSTMFLPLGAEVSLNDLIKGILIQSGNDATIVVAEGVAGSVEAFAAMMNKRAEELGLTGSHFVNPHGLPDPEQRMTARDLAVLAVHLIRDYPDYYEWFSEEEFTFNGITQRSRNPLLSLGADGLKTGHTDEAGYCLVASAEQNGRRIVFAMTGMTSVKQRAGEAKKLMDWGFRSFEQVVLVPAGQTAGEAAVLGGVEASVPLVTKGDVRVLTERGSAGDFGTKVAVTGPIPAPILEGERIGTLQVTRGDALMREEPLYAGKAVEQASAVSRLWDAVAGFVW